MSLTQNLEHASDMKGLLLQQFKGQPNFELLLDAWGVSVQDVEDMFWALFSERGLDVAVGKQLDILGTIVGEQRGALGDEDYRVRLRVRIRLNVSNGTDKDITEVFALLLVDNTPPIVIDEYYPAGLILRMLTYVTTTPAVLASVLREARSTAIDAQLIYRAAPEDEAFLTSGQAAPVTLSARGFASVYPTNWTSQTSPSARAWRSICYAPALDMLCAVADDGTAATQVMTSIDGGANWVSATMPSARTWSKVVWSPELGMFCAIASNGTTANQIATSTDGVTWVSQTSPEANQWFGLVWAAGAGGGTGLFVATAINGTHQVMASANGVLWVSHSASSADTWYDVCWSRSLGKFVAVAAFDNNKIMKSSDGTTWVGVTVTARQWRGVCWAEELGLFVAVASDGTSGGGTGVNQIMTSPDADTWTMHAAPSARQWFAICWAAEVGLLCAVAIDGTNVAQIMTSPNATDWTLSPSPSAQSWRCVCWAAARSYFFAAAHDGAVGVQVMRGRVISGGGKLTGVVQS